MAVFRWVLAERKLDNVDLQQLISFTFLCHFPREHRAFVTAVLHEINISNIGACLAMRASKKNVQIKSAT